MDIKVARRTDQVSGENCAYWRAGRCSRNPCRFLHGETLLPPAYHQYAKKSHPLPEKTPKYSPQQALVLNGGREVLRTKTTQESRQRICKYWMQGNCVHGDQCWNLHSWFYGDGFSTVAKLQGHKKAVTGIALPNGSDKLYSGSGDGTARIWDCHTGQCANVINLGGEVGSLISEGPWVFVGVPNAVKAWNIQTAARFTLDGPSGQVLAMVVANDMLFAGAQDGIILVWRGSSATCPFELAASLKGHIGAVVCLAVGGKMLYSGSMDHTIKVWDLETLQCTTTLNGHTDGGNLEVTYTHNKEYGVLALCGMTDAEAKPILFCSSNDNSVHLYELPSFLERGRLFARKEVRSIQIGPGGLFFTGDRTGLLTVWKWLAEPKVESS
ncbi:Zinc finger CCCH domain-containing protein [Quillaja saponaria]|uniref:Zinc finger CCCH domain-containing protein n=1 Tax=Quillaja saponaria TaxID=32244 RepID=A0AAD7L5I1_QUISA|nr:Zinc finger CCCH domain-containing protein [Quillaja saponaria]